MKLWLCIRAGVTGPLNPLEQGHVYTEIDRLVCPSCSTIYLNVQEFAFWPRLLMRPMRECNKCKFRMLMPDRRAWFLRNRFIPLNGDEGKEFHVDTSREMLLILDDHLEAVRHILSTVWMSSPFRRSQ